MKIYTFQLLNDYSGSPKVLMQLIQGWIKYGFDVHIVTGSKKIGFLSGIKGATYHAFWYKLAKNPLLRLINFTISQLQLFFIMLFKVKKDDVIYINTVLPFGAALLGKVIGCRVIYHIHETTMKPFVLKKFLFGIASWVSDEVIYVSEYLSKQEEFKKNRTHILYNAIEDNFLETAKNTRTQNVNPGNALMVCSLKDYKGVKEYLNLSKGNPRYHFRLVLNASQKEIDTYFSDLPIPSNLEIIDTQTNLHPHYQWADVILNLSRPDGWVETFGLTIIEGMAYGLPAIVPPVGGVTELVKENQNGFLVDCRNSDLLNEKLNLLLSNITSYNKMVKCSTEKINEFSEMMFIGRSLAILNKQYINSENRKIIPENGIKIRKNSVKSLIC